MTTLIVITLIVLTLNTHLEDITLEKLKTQKIHFQTILNRPCDPARNKNAKKCSSSKPKRYSGASQIKRKLHRIKVENTEKKNTNVGLKHMFLSLFDINKYLFS
jgi:hypothetical protein